MNRSTDLLGAEVGGGGVHGGLGLVRDDLLLVQQQVQGAQGAVLVWFGLLEGVRW